MIQLFIALASAGLIVWIFHTYSKKRYQSLQQPGPSEPASPPRSRQEIRESVLEPLDYSEINRAYRVADMHFSRGDLKTAEKWFIKVLALHEEHAETLNRLGVIYIHQDNPRRAEIIYRKLLSITQKEPAYYCNYGRCLYNQGRLEEAALAYENAIKLDATKPARLVSAGQIYYEKKDFQKALSYFAKAVELDPHNLDYLSHTAELAELVGDTERLLKSLRKILEYDPYNEGAKAKLAQSEINISKESGDFTQMDSAGEPLPKIP